MKKGKIIKKEVEDKEEIKSLKTIAKGAGIVFIGMIIGKIIGYVYTIIIARLGTEPYGMLHLGYSLVSFVTIFSLLGFQNGIVRFIPYYLARNDKARVKGAILSALKVCLPISLILAIATFFLSNKIAIIFFHNENLTSIFKIFSLMIPFTTLSTIFLHIFIAFKKPQFDILNKEFIEKMTRLAFTLLFISMGLGVIGASISYVISTFTVVLISFFILEKKVFPILKTKIKAKQYTGEMIKFSLPLVFSGFLLLLIGWTDTFMLGFFKTTSEVGIYNAANPTAALMFIFPTALTYLLLPIITHFYSKNEFGEIKKIYKVVSRWIFIVNLPILLMMIFFSPQIISIIFGNNYLPASFALGMLSVGYMFYTFSYSTGSHILSMAKKTKTILLITLIFAILNILLNYLLIPPYGINGAAIATSSSFILASIIYFIFTYKTIKCFPLKKSYYKPLFASIISIGLVYLLSLLIFKTMSVYYFFAIFFIFLIIYIILLFLFKSFELEDKEMFKILKKRLRKHKK